VCTRWTDDNQPGPDLEEKGRMHISAVLTRMIREARSTMSAESKDQEDDGHCIYTLPFAWHGVQDITM